MKRVVFSTEALPPEARGVLSGFEVHESTTKGPWLKEPAAVVGAGKVLAESDALICWAWQARAELISKMTNLKMVQCMSAGVDGVDFRSLPPGVQVFSNAGAFTESVGEHAWGLLLGVAKGVHLRNRKEAPRMLKGKTLLVVGCGAIGSEVARLSKSIGMRTVGVSRSFRSPELFDERHPLESLADAIVAADAIVVTLPYTRLTRGLLSHELLSRAKSSVILVNTGRGDTVDEEGALRWLRERPESRFATDVFWTKDGRESFDTPAWELPNFAGTLHNSGLPLGDDLAKVKVAAAWNVRRYFEGGDPLNRVDVSEYL